MIITGLDKNNISIAIDIVQAKYLVSILREATEEQLTQAAKDVYGSGFDDGDAVNALAAARSFTNVVGFYTDKTEAPHVAKTEEQAEALDGEGKDQGKRWLN